MPDPDKPPTYKRSVFWQGVVLIAVPIISGTTIFLLFTNLKASVDKKGLPAQSNARLSTKLNQVFLDVGEISRMTVNRMFVYGPSTDEAKLVQNKFVKDLQDARQLATNNKDATACLDSAEQVVNLSNRQLNDNEILVITTRPERLAIIERKLPNLLNRLLQYTNKGQSYLQSFWDKTGAMEDEQTRSKDQLRLFVYAAIIFNIVLGITLVSWTTTVLSRRMRQLICNVEDLYGGTPIAHKLSGNDELAYIDDVIIRAQQSLFSSEIHRQRILNMVAHDLRSPLMSARGNLQLLEEFAEDLPEIGILEIQKIHRNTDFVLEKARALLTNEFEAQAATLPTRSASAMSADTNETMRINARDFGESSIPPSEKYSRASKILSPNLVQLRLFLVVALLLVQTLSLFTLGQELVKVDETKALEVDSINKIAIETLIRINIQKGIIAKIDALLHHDETQNKNSVKYLDNAIATTDLLLHPKTTDVTKNLENIPDLTITDAQRISKNVRIVAQKVTASKEPYEVGRAVGLSILSLLEFDSRATAEFANFDKIRQRRDSIAADLTTLTIFSLIVNLILGVIMLIAFSWRTEKRLQFLMADAQALGSRQKFQKEIPGSDELAQLDSAIHFTPKSLNIASATRARIIKRLAEDLHTPLMDSLIRLDRFKAMTMGEPSEKCSKYLQLSKTSVQKVLSLLNDLLTMEQLNSGKIDLSIENCSGFDIVDDAINMASGLAVAKNILIVNESVDCKITADGERLVQGWNG